MYQSAQVCTQQSSAMKVRDRITGLIISLPVEVVPSRYEILGDGVTLNGEFPLPGGEVLLSDGSQECSLNFWRGTFTLKERSPDDQAKYDLVSRAVKTIAEICRKGSEVPSPLLPQDLLSMSEFLPIEELLSKTLEAGHLHEIGRRPRLDMHYREEVTPVSRARRLAPSAGRHLASHTSCWQQRTLCNVVPKTILALFSQDDYAIYENRLFVRLLDRLGEHLVRRLAEAETILEQFLEAQNFQKAKDTYFRLRNDICNIWGETFDENQTSKQLEISQRTVELLQELLRGIRSLKQTELYRNIPRSSQVPDQIHMTNILSHDQHYRHLAPLWKLHQEASTGMPDNPEQRLRSSRDIFESYVDYIGVLLRRTLRQLGPEALKAFGLELKRERFEWHLSSRIQGERLVFIPITEATQVKLPLLRSKEGIRIPIMLDGEYRDFDPLAALREDSPTMQFVATPRDFYVEEKMVTFLNAWCWQPVFRNFGKEMVKVPAPVANYLSGHAEFGVEASRVVILAPVSADSRLELSKILKQHANDGLQKEFELGLAETDLLATCPGCRTRAEFEPREKGTFKALCRRCGLEWGVFTRKGERQALLSNTSGGSGGFYQVGRWHMELRI